MMFLVLDIQSTNHTDQGSQLSAWVNTHEHNEAIAILSKELSLQGWVISDIIESSTTSEDDYFPPCTSLDAYKEAEAGVFALRYKNK